MNCTFAWDDSRFSQRGISWIWAVLMMACCLSTAPTAMAQRVFGLDTSSAANASPPTATMWTNAFNDADGDGVAYKFAILRSDRGGTTVANGFLDDSHFYTSISRATAAGLLCGEYHYVRFDIATSTGVDEAQHMLNHAGMYMKPGYILPVLDLEAGNTLHSTAALTNLALDFVNTIKNAKGVYPIVYTNSSYNNDEVNASFAFSNTAVYPKTGPLTYQWLARPSGNLLTGQPVAAAGYPDPYGVWDPYFTTKAASVDPVVKPWAFWQNGSGSPNGFLIDYNAANGNIEFVKDFLVPALWIANANGDWSTVANWNSSNAGYIAGDPSTGPAPRLPNSLDTVKLTGTGIVTLSSGAHNIRKLYTAQTLNITGGSLTIGYQPGSGGQFDIPAEINSTVTLSNAASYTAHTTQIDANALLNLAGGTVQFSNINLAPHSTTPAKIMVTGNVTLAPYGGAGTSTITAAAGVGTAPTVDIGAISPTLTVNDGSASDDVTIPIVVKGAGGTLVKAGAGTLRLDGSNLYSGGTVVSAGTLRLNGSTACPTLVSAGGTLTGIGSAGGNVTVDGILAPGNTLGSLTITTGNYVQNAGSTLAIEIAGTAAGSFDRVVLPQTVGHNVTLAGTLAITRPGGYTPNLGDSFQIVTAHAVAGQFDQWSGTEIDAGKVFGIGRNSADITLVVVPNSPLDFNKDGHIDQSEMAVFANCSTRSTVEYDPFQLPAGCDLTPDGLGHIAVDIDQDGDVDMEDFGAFQRCYTGTGFVTGNCPN